MPPKSLSEKKSPSNSTRSPSRPKKEEKNSMSNVDIEERRKSLTKITRQKSTGKRYVAVTSSAGRVLKRLTNTKHGSVALLIGRVMAERDSAEAAASKARDRALAKINKKAALEGDKADKGRECIEVHAVFELHSEVGQDLCAANDASSVDLSTHASLPHLRSLCKSLGLSVVGVGVAPGSKKKNKDNSACLWSPNHVHRALQIRSAVMPKSTKANKGSKKEGELLFCVLSLATAPDEPEDANGEAGKGGKKKSTRVDKATREANPGLVMEAFELSTQAVNLADKGVLTMKRLPYSGDSGPNENDPGDKGGKKKARGRAVINKMNMGTPLSSTSNHPSKPDAELIQLSSAVLTQSDESTAIDPLLLAVPLPIVALDALAPTVKTKPDKSVLNRGSSNGSGATKGREGSVEWKPPSLEMAFEHSFPSPCEMAEDAECKENAQHHVCDVCEQLGAPGHPQYAVMYSRLRDIHLLYYLSQYLDIGSMMQLGKSLRNSKATTLPHAVKTSLEMLRLSLSSASSGKGSSGTGKKKRQPRITREQRARGETGGDDVEEI